MIIQLWQSYVGPRAPTTLAGGRIGLGWTRLQASQQARHVGNTIHFEQFRLVILSDFDRLPLSTSQQEELAWAVLGGLEEIENRSPREQRALEFLRAHRYASAWSEMYPPPLCCPSQETVAVG